ncbi:MAG: helix-turn-helix transcriptional regulator, partial [Gorillibacterium sp.]|nr:helix-turn-helix transcriptional regulator [Gorillibacterium sp.]
PVEVQVDAEEVLADDLAKVVQRHLVRGELESFQSLVHQQLAQSFVESRAHFVKLIFQLYLIVDRTANASGIALESGQQLWLRPEMVLSLDTVEKAEQFLFRLAIRLHQGSKDRAEDTDDSIIHAVRAFIDENYMYDINLTMLAKRFSYNPSYFSEMFKIKVGKTFIVYITEIRMTQAKRLLTQTTLSLWDIAELTGFSNASYFSSKFKRMYGITPSDFRHPRT